MKELSKMTSCAVLSNSEMAQVPMKRSYTQRLPELQESCETHSWGRKAMMLLLLGVSRKSHLCDTFSVAAFLVICLILYRMQLRVSPDKSCIRQPLKPSDHTS